MDGHHHHVHHEHATVTSIGGDMAGQSMHCHTGAAAHLQHDAPHEGAMAMSFSQSVDCVLLFSWWHSTTLAQYIVSLLGVFCLCVLSEWLAAYTRRATPAATGCHASAERTGCRSSRPVYSNLRRCPPVRTTASGRCC
eukprot:1442375-Prymnesium_polylepis.1